MVNMTTEHTDPPKHRTNFVMGPDGFTESFNDHTVDLLVRMGLIEFVKTTSSYDWETKFYQATGRGPMKGIE